MTFITYRQITAIVRWQSRKRETYYSYWGHDNPHDDGHWAAILVESERINGEPRQRHLAYLCGFTEHQIKHPAQQLYTWERAIKALDRLGKRITPEQRRQVEVALAKRIGRPKPTKREIGRPTQSRRQPQGHRRRT